MASEQNILLRIRSAYNGEGFANFRKDVGQAKSGIGDFASSLSSVNPALAGVSSNIRSVSNLFSAGSFWGAAAVAVGLLVKTFNSLSEALDKTQGKLALAAEKLSKYRDAVNDTITATKSQLDATNSALDAEVKAKSKQIDLAQQLAKAEMEVAKQREIAAGGDGSQAEAAFWAASTAAARDKLDLEKQVAKEREAAALAAIESAQKELNSLAERNRLETARRDAIETQVTAAADLGTWYQQIGDTLSGFAAAEKNRQERAAAALANLKETNDNYKNLSSSIADNEAQMAKLKAIIDSANKSLANARDELDANATKEKILNAQLEADTIKSQNAIAAARDAEVAAQKKRDKEMADNFVRAYEEALAAEKAAADKAREEEKAAQEKFAQTAKQKALDELDDQLAEAKSKLEQWEREAKGARGKDYDSWAREEKQREKDQKKEAQRQQREEQKNNERLEILEDKERRGGKSMTPQEKEELERRRQWRDAQNPDNNPFKKEVDTLSQKRNDLLQSANDKLDTLNDNIKKAIVV